MKHFMFILTLTLLASTASQAQNSDVQAIHATIEAFAQAGDHNNADRLAEVLDDNYQVVMNQLFGSQEVSVMPRAIYLEKIRSKEFGGDDREVTVESVLLNGLTASAKVSLVGEKMTAVSILTLVKDAEGQWKLIGDMPAIN